MNREEAIKVLEEVKRVAEIYESEDVKAYNMAIKLLKQEPCDEAISRQAVLDEIDDTNRRGGFGCKLSYTRCRGHIEQLPSVTSQPKIGHWIPVSEKLPTKEEYIANNGLFIVSDGNRTYAEYFDVYNSMMYFGEPTMNGFRVDRCVIAWMPLPEPYKAESEDKE